MELKPPGGPEPAPVLSLEAASELDRLPLANAALSAQLAAILQALQQHLPVHHFAALVEDRGTLTWQPATTSPLSTPFQQNETISDEQLTTLLTAEEGWCKCQVEHGTIRWLVGQTSTIHTQQLQLLLEQLARRYSLQQATVRIESFSSPLRQHISHWQEKLESFNRLLRLVDSLPSRQLFAQLDATIHYWMGSHDL